MSVGGAMNFIGTGIEFGYLLSQGKKGEAWTKLGMSAAFIGTGKLGLMAAERAVGSGLNTATKTLINGINITAEKTIGADAEKMLTK